ncbi:gamma-interferon-inducible lysosomal thiol reductase-like [Ixodes scapularis]|uniref:gamma-interferon-inducible lysosomal thiol reductase-like n=1 Tax=Ixodes scapularis TaxID=6945 RepID=UPI001A9FB22B|nr:gamma-interferon-inducible lysosomal thiol reductase-like [Ixodes scapularis]
MMALAAPFLLLCLAAHGMAKSDSEEQPMVNLTVFYDPYDYKSLAFFREQLKPAYEKLWENVLVELVPYGRAQTREATADEPLSFVCSEGTGNCMENIIHSCAISLIPSTEDLLMFVICLLWPRISEGYENTVRECARDIPGMDLQDILDCSSSSQGQMFLQQMGARMAEMDAPVTELPSVALDGKMVKTQFHLWRSLKTEVCGHFKHKVPQQCKYFSMQRLLGRKWSSQTRKPGIRSILDDSCR